AGHVALGLITGAAGLTVNGVPDGQRCRGKHWGWSTTEHPGGRPPRTVVILETPGVAGSRAGGGAASARRSAEVLRALESSGVLGPHPTVVVGQVDADLASGADPQAVVTRAEHHTRVTRVTGDRGEVAALLITLDADHRPTCIPKSVLPSRRSGPTSAC